jgi:adenylate cyclase
LGVRSHIETLKSRVGIKGVMTGEGSFFVTSSLISLVATVILWALCQFGFLNTLELKSLDLFQRYNNPIDDPGVVMVEVDQRSLTALSEQGIRWPWPRQVYAPLVEVCAKGGARGIIFDIIFSEPSSYGKEDDLEFARAIRRAQNVFLPIGMSSNPGYSKDISAIKRFGIEDKAPGIPFREAQSYVPPIGELMGEAKGLGDVTVSPDSDGVYRRIPLYIRYQGYLFPSLALFPLRERLSLKGKNILFDAKPLPVNEKGELLLHYYGQGFRFPTFNVLDIVSAYQNPEGPPFDRVASRMRGQFVVFALTAPGLLDLKPTAVTSQSPGAYIHGTLLANLLRDHHIRAAKEPWRFLLIFLAGIGLGFFILSTISFWRNSLIVLLFMMGCAAISFGAFHFYRYWMGFLLYEASFLIVLGIAATYRYSTEGKRRRETRRLFSQYMSEVLVRELEAHPEKAKLGGERRSITVFFSDLANFTGISEQFEPEKIVGLLNYYFTEMSQIILDSRGIIDKYQGDGIMAFWGAPIPVQDHATRGCLAALACQRRMREINEKLQGDDFPPLSMRIGLHSGEAIVGNMGSTQRFDYTIIGDNVNLASRLEGVNKHFGTGIIISQDTYQLAKGQIEARELDLVAVPGRQRPIRVFQPLGEKGKITKIDKKAKALFEDGLKSYRIRRFEEAQRIFERVVEINPNDQPSRIFIARCKELMEAPPTKWDGVFRPRWK